METSTSRLDRFSQYTPNRFSINEINNITSDLSISNLIGSGGSSRVYVGQFPLTGQRVAVKVLNQNALAEEMFMAEVTTMYKTYHRNLVTLVGFCFEDTMKALVFEYMAGGSLGMVLSNSSQPLVNLYVIMIQVANGLSYLHDDCPEQIIHHDVNPGNVLLDLNLFAKIADFGVAKLLNRDSPHLIMLREEWTRGFVAPETLVKFSPITCKSDVFSFGKILFAILRTSRNPGYSCHEIWQEVENGRLDDIIIDCNFEVGDRQKAKILLLIGFWCIQHTPSMRPSMRAVANMLENEILVKTPPNPFYTQTLLQLPPPSMQPS